jgi:hypothetical protein
MAGQLQLPLPDRPIFFVDRCLGSKSFAQPLRDLGFRIEHLNDHFPFDAEDALWIPAVAERSWIIVSADFRIRHRAPEIEAFRSCGARMLLLSQKLSKDDRIFLFADAMSKIEKEVRSRAPPWIASIQADRAPSAAGRRRARLEFLEG